MYSAAVLLCVVYRVTSGFNAIQEKRQITFQYYEYTPQKEKIPGRGEGLSSLSSAKLLEFKQKIPTAKAAVGMIKSDCTS